MFGVHTALVTPFQADGGLDVDAFVRLTERQIRNGIAGLVPCGTTGESPVLDDDGFNSCSIISGTNTTPTRRALTAGTYYVQVRRFSNNTTVGQYYLNVDVAP